METLKKIKIQNKKKYFKKQRKEKHMKKKYLKTYKRENQIWKKQRIKIQTYENNKNKRKKY